MCKMIGTWDHLHIRGEYRTNILTDEQSMGITSTYVENTLLVTPTTATTKDHLHIRGEYVATYETK